MKGIRNRSGKVNSKDNLVAFLYLLLRDDVASSRIEEIMKDLSQSQDKYQFSNGWLANYAKDIAERLK